MVAAGLACTDVITSSGDVLWPLGVGLVRHLQSATFILGGCLLLGCQFCQSSKFQPAGSHPIQSVWPHLHTTAKHLVSSAAQPL